MVLEEQNRLQGFLVFNMCAWFNDLWTCIGPCGMHRQERFHFVKAVVKPHGCDLKRCAPCIGPDIGRYLAAQGTYCLLGKSTYQPS